MSHVDFIPPPPVIRWLVEIVGVDAALRLVETHGGTRMFVPKNVSQDSEIAIVTKIDTELLGKLAKSRGGETIKMPVCREWRVRIYRLRDGASYSTIARKLSMSEDQVWLILNAGGMTRSQLTLPF